MLRHRSVGRVSGEPGRDTASSGPDETFAYLRTSSRAEDLGPCTELGCHKMNENRKRPPILPDEIVASRSRQLYSNGFKKLATSRSSPVQGARPSKIFSITHVMMATIGIQKCHIRRPGFPL